jgi:hypothetical protein
MLYLDKDLTIKGHLKLRTQNMPSFATGLPLDMKFGGQKINIIIKNISI